MSNSKILESLRAREARAIEIIEDLEKKIKERHQYVSRDQLRIWNKNIQHIRSVRIAIRTMIAMVRT